MNSEQKFKPSSKDERDARLALASQTRELVASAMLELNSLYLRSIMTLSSAFLAISVAFVANWRSSTELKGQVLLISSWSLFGAAILTALCGIMLNIAAGNAAHSRISSYIYENVKLEKTRIEKIDALANIAIGSLFASAVICTIVFASVNL